MQKTSRILIKNANVVKTDKVKSNDILIESGTIKQIDEHLQGSYSLNIETINADGLYVAPGFIDLQVNGGAGHNFGEASVEGIKEIISFHISHGTTGLLPTTVTAPPATIRSTIEEIKNTNHPAILGMHIEGPFISRKKKGAQNPEYILEPSTAALNEIIGDHQNFVKIVTLAPELDGAERVLERIKEFGVPSLGHSDASYEETIDALNKGVSLFTHMFNAMSGFHHREPGAVCAAFESDAMTELIADGIHVHPAAIRLLFREKGSDKVCLITDAMSAAGLSDGSYTLGGLDITVEKGIARLEDGTLAGSTLTMDHAVKNFKNFTDLSLPEIMKTASLNPAKVLGIDEFKGSIEEGKDADLVILDENFDVRFTVIGGEIVYDAKG